MSLLISLEGIDGSGKSTLIEKINRSLENSIVTREPRGTELGFRIWKLLDESIAEEGLIKGNKTAFFLFMAAHNEHVESVIKPQLASGKTVIVDRYIDSTFVYQGLNKKLGIENIDFVMKNLIETPFPQVTFIPDIDPVKAQERLNVRKEKTGEFTNFDSMSIEFHQKIRSFFHKLKELFPTRVFIINADQTPNEVFNDVWEILQSELSISK